MKRFLLLIAAIIAINIANAQGFDKSIEIGGTWGLGTYDNKSADVSFVGGYSFDSKVFVGAGIGFRYTDALYYKSFMKTSGQYFSESYESRSQEYLIPLYARVKYKFIDKGVSPFIQGNIGYAFNVGGSTNAADGLYIEPALGVDFKLNNNLGLYFSLGYALQQSQYTHFTITENKQSKEDHKDLAGGISIKVGFRF